MSNDISADVEYYVNHAELDGTSFEVTPKLVEIIKVSPFANGNLGLTASSDFLFKGKMYPTTIHKDGKRTVFDPEPIDIDGKLRYIEYKGFGRNGKEMYLRNHSLDDVNFGMFLDEAMKEFMIGSYLTDSGCKVPIPLAVGRIKRKDYFRYCLDSLKNEILGVCLWDAGIIIPYSYPSDEDIPIKEKTRLVFPDLAKRWKSLDIIIEDEKKEFKDFSSKLTHLPNESRIKAQIEFIRLNSKCQSIVIPEVERIAEEIYNRVIESYRIEGDVYFIKFMNELGLFPLIEAFATEKDVGVVIRAVESPFRVGEAPYENEALAKIDKKYLELVPKYGETFRIMLENGVANYMSHPYNWTTAGETSDMEDAEFLVDREEIIINKKAIIHNNRNIFTKLKHEAGCGDLFIKGMFGRVLGIDDAAKKAYDILLSSRIN